MKFLVDMNLSPTWVGIIKQAGFDAVHWSDIGEPRAPDQEIMEWAKAQGCIVFTHDLDFGAILAATKSDSPSVIQIRTQDINPRHIGDFVISAIKKFQDYLIKGALISVDEKRARARILPLKE